MLLCLCQQKSRIRLCLHGKSSQHEHPGLKKKSCTLLTETLDTFLCPTPSFLREITPIFDHEARAKCIFMDSYEMPLLKMLPSALSNEQVTLKVAKAISRW